MRPLRILHTEASVGWGGQELRILSEAEGMASRGHQVTILCPPEATLLAEGHKRHLDVVPLNIGRKGIVGWVAIYRWLATHAVDVVNTHSSTDTWLVALASQLLHHSPPIVRTRHISARISESATTRWLYQRATKYIVTTGDALRRQLIEENGYNPESIISVPTGIDPAVFRPGDQRYARDVLGLPRDRFIVGIVATLRTWKGHRFLIDAASRLDREDVLLLIVGDGPYRTAVEAAILEHNLTKRALMVGNQADVVPWLHAMDIFALPSYANEGVPQAILQAMMCSLPVVSTAVGAIEEAVLHGTTGIIVPPQDSLSLSAAIQDLLESPQKARSFGVEGRSRAGKLFSLESMLERMETVFRRALRSQSRP